MSTAISVDPVVAIRLERVEYAERGGRAIALRDVALDVGAGEIVGVAGHVGAGKTTLALAAAGLLGRAVPARVTGEIVRRVHAEPPASFVFANPWTQLTELGGTVEEEVAVGPENQGLPSAIIRERVDTALAWTNAAALATRIPTELSGGELQRVALASALALDAPLIVLDEPTAQLDPDAARALAGALRALAARGSAILLVEQNLELLASLATRVLVLADGVPLAMGDPHAVLDRWPPLDPRLGAPADVLARSVVAPIARTFDEQASPVLEVRGLVAGYGDRDVLRGVSLVIPRGAAVAWMGPNGAGKSTLARTIVALVPGRRGRVSVNGTTLDAMPVEQRARHVGLVFQNPDRQLFARTVLDEALFGPRALGVRRADALAQARAALATVGLEGQERVHPGDLSPQLRRRLAIAATLAMRPPLLLLDEPTAGQDAEGREWIARAIDAQRAHGAAAVITHDASFAKRRCDFIVTIAHGQLSSTGERHVASPPSIP